MSRFYHTCCTHIGKCVNLCTIDGRRYHGRIVNVTPTHVHLMPIARRITQDELNKESHKIQTAIASKQKENGEEIFFNPSIIPLAAIYSLLVVGTAPYWGGFGPYGAY
jgi:hypothetical protein